MDIRILSTINGLIVDSGYQFEMHETFDQSAFLVVLMSEEKEILVKERGWCFSDEIAQ